MSLRRFRRWTSMTRRLEIIVLCAALVMAAAGLASSTEQSFAVEPDDRSAVVDSTVSLPCKVNDLAGKLQWTKDDFALGTNRNLSYHGYPRYAMTGSDANGNIIIIALYMTFYSKILFAPERRTLLFCI